MPRFKKNFCVFMLVSTALLFIVLDTVVLMSYEYIPVKDESFELIKIFAAAAVYAASFPLLTIVLARGCVKYLKSREYYMESSGEMRLFRNFVLAEAAMLIINTAFLYERSKPYFKNAYMQQRVKLGALNDTNETIQSKLSLLKASYESCMSYTRAAVIIFCISEAVIMLSGARVLVKAYQEQKSRFKR